MHVDQFIDSDLYHINLSRTFTEPFGPYARFFFHLCRLPAILRGAFAPYIKEYQLYCEYQGEEYRVTGASRLGDIWLTKDFGQSTGYQLRVDIAACGNWTPVPKQTMITKEDWEQLNSGKLKTKTTYESSFVTFECNSWTLRSTALNALKNSIDQYLGEQNDPS